MPIRNRAPEDDCAIDPRNATPGATLPGGAIGPISGKDCKSGSHAQRMIVLGIETTCDETAAALVARDPDGRGRILSDIVLSQTEEHAAFGGVVPEIAARAHVEVLDLLIERALGRSRHASCRPSTASPPLPDPG